MGFGLFWLVTSLTASGMLIVRTFHSLSYDVLITNLEAAAEVHIGRIFTAYFLVYSSVGNRGKHTSGWLQAMESFSVIWCSFLLVNVQFLVWKVGEYLLLIIRNFVLFENVLFQQIQLPYSLCSYICSPKSKRKTVSYARFIITATDKIRVK